jgi:hypothetical protein
MWTKGWEGDAIDVSLRIEIASQNHGEGLMGAKIFSKATDLWWVGVVSTIIISYCLVATPISNLSRSPNIKSRRFGKNA